MNCVQLSNCASSCYSFMGTVASRTLDVAREAIALVAITSSLPIMMLYNAGCYLFIPIDSYQNHATSLAGAIAFWNSYLLARIYLAVSSCFGGSLDNSFRRACNYYSQSALKSLLGDEDPYRRHIEANLPIEEEIIIAPKIPLSILEELDEENTTYTQDIIKRAVPFLDHAIWLYKKYPERFDVTDENEEMIFISEEEKRIVEKITVLAKKVEEKNLSLDDIIELLVDIEGFNQRAKSIVSLVIYNVQTTLCPVHIPTKEAHLDGNKHLNKIELCRTLTFGQSIPLPTIPKVLAKPLIAFIGRIRNSTEALEKFFNDELLTFPDSTDDIPSDLSKDNVDSLKKFKDDFHDFLDAFTQDYEEHHLLFFAYWLAKQDKMGKWLKKIVRSHKITPFLSMKKEEILQITTLIDQAKGLTNKLSLEEWKKEVIAYFAKDPSPGKLSEALFTFTTAPRPVVPIPSERADDLLDLDQFVQEFHKLREKALSVYSFSPALKLHLQRFWFNPPETSDLLVDISIDDRFVRQLLNHLLTNFPRDIKNWTDETIRNTLSLIIQDKDKTIHFEKEKQLSFTLYTSLQNHLLSHSHNPISFEIVKEKYPEISGWTSEQFTALITAIQSSLKIETFIHSKNFNRPIIGFLEDSLELHPSMDNQELFQMTVKKFPQLVPRGTEIENLKSPVDFDTLVSEIKKAKKISVLSGGLSIDIKIWNFLTDHLADFFRTRKQLMQLHTEIKEKYPQEDIDLDRLSTLVTQLPEKDDRDPFIGDEIWNFLEERLEDYLHAHKRMRFLFTLAKEKFPEIAEWSFSSFKKLASEMKLVPPTNDIPQFISTYGIPPELYNFLWDQLFCFLEEESEVKEKVLEQVLRDVKERFPDSNLTSEILRDLMHELQQGKAIGESQNGYSLPDITIVTLSEDELPDFFHEIISFYNRYEKDLKHTLTFFEVEKSLQNLSFHAPSSIDLLSALKEKLDRMSNKVIPATIQR